MDYMFDSPRWSWRLQKTQEQYAKHDTSCTIFGADHSKTQTKTTVQMVPPPEVFPFLRSFNHVDGDFESRFYISFEGKRASLVLLVLYDNEGAEETAFYYRLFYWTPSTSPVWLKRYFG